MKASPRIPYESSSSRKCASTWGAGLFLLLKPYRPLVATLVVLTIAGNGLSLVVPKLIAHAIDAYMQRSFVLSTVVLQFFVVAFLVFSLTYLQSIVQTYASERVAKDLRTRLAAKIAVQSYSLLEKLTGGETAHQPDVGRRRSQAVRVPRWLPSSPRFS